jgi:hypothetical protein
MESYKMQQVSMAGMAPYVTPCEMQYDLGRPSPALDTSREHLKVSVHQVEHDA